MSIEQKISELLAESKVADEVQLEEPVEEPVEVLDEEVEDIVEEIAEEQVEDVKLDISEDLFALTNGEDLSEEFKTKAAVIFEAAIVSRVKQEVAKLEEAFEARLAKVAEENQEGLVEKIDGYLNYVVETWIAQNEIALESGMKSEILENFVSGLKGLFEEHYIDIPDEKYDVLSSLGTTIEELEAKLDEQVAANVEMHKIISEAARVDIIKDACAGLTDTEVEKFTDLAEELKFEDSESFSGKVQTIRENYFTTKATNKSIDSVVTDEPITLNEEKYVSPQMAAYVAAIKNLK